MLTPNQVAERLGVGAKHVRALLRAGKLRGTQRDGRHWIVTIADLDAFIKARGAAN